ncbi:unnamed protein product [Rotaria sordida]|uniref:eRF1 domain-containing protein n=1 Tax=Rotaria sordida TaxID=392033 RepID=A0A815IC32_9BILA|nr:unnamed protein product [Rotaria sordida]
MPKNANDTKCLQEKILERVIISDDGENDFNQAIDLIIETLNNIKFIREKKVLARYFNKVSKDGSHYCFGVTDTLKALEMGSIETLIVWENFDVNHYFLRHSQMQEMKMTISCVDQEKYTDFDWEHIEEMSLLEWFVKNHKKFGATLEIVTDKSQQGYRFVHDFDSIGGILHHKINLQNTSIEEDAELIDYSKLKKK